jgi:hypothetical protein
MVGRVLQLAEATAKVALQSRSGIGEITGALLAAGRGVGEDAAQSVSYERDGTIMADVARLDLQREANEEQTGVTKSEEACQRLESFKQGEIDRWGREASIDTPIKDFYIEHP